VSSPSVSPRLSRRMLSPSHSPRSSPVARYVHDHLQLFI
jgi:hypothetical protein